MITQKKYIKQIKKFNSKLTKCEKIKLKKKLKKFKDKIKGNTI
jgi:hypothetical protein